METKFDGKPHALNDKMGYILKKSPGNTIRDVKHICVEFLKEYATYLYDNDKEKTIESLHELFSQKFLAELNTIQGTCYCPTGTHFVFRPPWLVSDLSEEATIALKFERAPNDNLGEVEKDENR